MPNYSSRRRSYTAIEQAVPGCYFRVRCLHDGCDWEVIKASPRNVELAKVGHQKLSHYGHAWSFSVVPLKREEIGR